MCAESIPYNPLVNSLKSQLHVQNHFCPHEKDSGYIIGSYFNPNIGIRVQGIKDLSIAIVEVIEISPKFFEGLTPCSLFSADFLIFPYNPIYI